MGMETWQLAALLTAGMLCVILVFRLLLALVRRRRAKSLPRETPMKASPATPEQEQFEADATEVIVRFDELATRIDSQLQQRAEKLEKLLAQADEKLKALQELVEASAGESDSAAPALDLKHMEVVKLSRKGMDAVEIARRLAMDIGKVELILNLERSNRRRPRGRRSKR